MRKVPEWNQYFMKIAQSASLRSKDPETQVGCVIVDEEGHIVSTGYNGMPTGMKEDIELWKRPVKYDYVCHAEANAICHTTKSLKDCILYCTLYPCKECAKLIASCKIKKVFYSNPKYENEITKEIFKRCNIECIKI